MYDFRYPVSDDRDRCPECGQPYGDGYWEPICACERERPAPLDLEDDDDDQFAF